MRITKKKLKEFINKVADIKPSDIKDDDADCYYSKIDGKYITRVGMENTFKILMKNGITEQIQGKSSNSRVVSIGYNPIEKKWYGWSHRAIYGFGIGSTCKKGMCHYRPSNKEDVIKNSIAFWEDEEYHLDTTGVWDKENGEEGVRITWTYSDTVPNEALRGTEGGTFSYFSSFGKGEWVANTMEEAKEMAIDFAEGVG